MTSCIARETTGLCGVQHRHGLSQAGILPSVSSDHDTAQFSTDYSCFKISVQTVPVARRARSSHGKNVLQHASRAQAVERSLTIFLPDTSITKLHHEFERAHLNEHCANKPYVNILGK